MLSLRRRSLAAFLAVTLAIAACGPGPGRTAAGVVIAVDSGGGRVGGFTLRTMDGAILVFRVGELEIDEAAFPASHLVEHTVTLLPISVAYREVDGDMVVYRMVDAPWATPRP